MKRFTIEDIPELKPFIEISDYHEYNSNLVTMLMWDNQYHVYYEVYDHFALVFTKEEGEDPEWLTPYCAKEHRQEALLKMKEISAQYQIPFAIHSLNKEFKDWLLNAYPFAFFIYENQDAQDYIYDVQMQRSLSGKKMQKRRNHYHAFEKLYGDRYVFKKLERSDFEHIFTYLDEWKASKSEDQHASIDVERTGIELMLEHFELLELDGGVIYIDGKLQAFSIVSKLSSDTIQIHVEKANRAYRGLSIAIVKLFLETVDDSIRYINREDDMGLPALRKAKSDMHPIYKIHKYSASYSPLLARQAEYSDLDAIKELWLKRFEDETIESTQYYFKHLFNMETCSVLYHENELLAMMQFHPKTIILNNQETKAYFLFGVAVNENYEGCGYMRMLWDAMKLKYGEDCLYLLQAYHPEVYYGLRFQERYYRNRTKLDKEAYHKQGGTLTSCHDAAMLADLYQSFVTARNGYALRTKEDYQNTLIPSLEYYEESCLLYQHNGKALGYLFLNETEEVLTVSEIIYQSTEALQDMLALLSEKPQKIYIYSDETIAGKTKATLEMMALNLPEQTESLFIHERI